MVIDATVYCAVWIMIYLIYTVIEHFWGRFTNNPQVIAQASVRLHMAVNSIIILFLILLSFTLFMGERGVTPGIIGMMLDPSNPPVIEDYVFDYLSTLIFSEVPKTLGSVAKYLAIIQSVGMTMNFTIKGVISGFLMDFTLFERLASFMIMLISPLIGSLYVQLLVIILITQFTPYLLTVGFILRFFDLTRRAGSFLMALAFSSYVIFITMYALNGYIMNNLISSKVIFDYWSDIFSHSISGLSGEPGIVGQAFYLFFTFFPYKILYSVFFKIVFNFTFVAFQGIIVPTFSTMVAITSINALSKVLD